MNVVNISLDKLKNYREHTFPLYSGEQLDRLVESISSLGVLTPIIVRALSFKGNSYEILAGHNRVYAAGIAALREIPAVIVNPKSEDEAKLIVIETNMCQRSIEEIPVSIKAKVISEWYKCIRSQGMRIDLMDEVERLERYEELNFSSNSQMNPSIEKSASNPDKIEEKSTSYQIDNLPTSSEYIAEKTGLSIIDIQRLIRLAKLPDELLKKVDDGRIPYMAAYELSFVPNDTNIILNIVLDTAKIQVTIKGAQALRHACSSGRIITKGDEIIELLKAEKLKKEKPLSVTIKPKAINKYFPGEKSKKAVAERIEQSLELTEQIIPSALSEHNIQPSEYKILIPQALNYYFEKGAENHGEDDQG